MKKTLIITGLVLVLGVGSIFAYADNGANNRFINTRHFPINNEEMEKHHEERIEIRKEYLDEAVKGGRITADEAKTLEEHYEYMENLHRDRIEDVSRERMEEFHNERMESNREYLNKSVEEGKVTKEEAKSWEDHFDYMEEFHRENGYGPGACGRGMMRGLRGGRGMGRGSRMGW